MTSLQTTIKYPTMCRGVGLHNGKDCSIHLIPTVANSGILFQNLDFPNFPAFKLTTSSIHEGMLATSLQHPENSKILISTVEHLLSALHALEIDNILIQVQGGEIPILDGTASPFVFLIQSAGIQPLEASKREYLKITKKVRVTNDQGGWAELSPVEDEQKSSLKVNLDIDFPECLIKKQSISIEINPTSFVKELSFARTFVEKKHIEYLRNQGLTLGGSLENALVIDGNQVVNPDGLRTNDECVRHKAMDVVGDLFAGGTMIAGVFSGYKTGHTLNAQLLKKLIDTKNAWEYV